MFWGYGLSWGWIALMMLGMAVWIALLVVLIWTLINWLSRKTPPTTPPQPYVRPGEPTAMEILQQRYARGEIDAETYQQMRANLQASTTKQAENSPPMAAIR